MIAGAERIRDAGGVFGKRPTVRGPPSVGRSADAANTSVGRPRGGAKIGMKVKDLPAASSLTFEGVGRRRGGAKIGMKAPAGVYSAKRRHECRRGKHECLRHNAACRSSSDFRRVCRHNLYRIWCFSRVLEGAVGGAKIGMKAPAGTGSAMRPQEWGRGRHECPRHIGRQRISGDFRGRLRHKKLEAAEADGAVAVRTERAAPPALRRVRRSCSW